MVAGHTTATEALISEAPELRCWKVTTMLDSVIEVGATRVMVKCGESDNGLAGKNHKCSFSNTFLL